ncbi:hypothetical protein BGX38DRAFT_906930 [Terfezia claveryi]|nr:hypothetical protein BGX38DRAFT_906930 [Terfezia claveryi]
MLRASTSRNSPLTFRKTYPEFPFKPKPLIAIASTTFHRSSSPPQDAPLFPNLTFTLQPHCSWAILGPTPVKRAFLDILQGATYLPHPPNGRTYPKFTQEDRSPSSASGIARVDFGSRTEEGGMVGGGAGGGGYISARYESLRGAEDITLEKWLISGASLNSDAKAVDLGTFGRVVRSLQLTDLLAFPVMTLSHGQVRRAKLAAALLNRPQVLLVDEPFMGLDPPNTFTISYLLQELASVTMDRFTLSTTPVLALRPQDPVPSWVDNVAVLGEGYNVVSIGNIKEVLKEMEERHNSPLNTAEPWCPKKGLFAEVWRGVNEYGDREEGAQIQNTTTEGDSKTSKEPLVSLSSITIKYGSSQPRYILRDFSWTIRRGDRWGVFGPNGSGKTTLLALLTSDHPQTYSQEITLFGHKRGDPGVSVFDVQSRIGHSSPEVLAFWPRHLSLRRTVEAAWAETPLAKPTLPPGANEAIAEVLEFFKDALPRRRKVSVVDWVEGEGEVVDGEIVAGEVVDQEVVDQEVVNGEVVEGKLVDGDLVDGKVGKLVDLDLVDGKVVNRGVVDQEVVDQDVVDGELVEGKLVDGGVVDQEVVEGKLVDGDLVDQEVGRAVDGGVVDQEGGTVVDQEVVDGGVVDQEAGRAVDGGVVDQEGETGSRSRDGKVSRWRGSESRGRKYSRSRGS